MDVGDLRDGVAVEAALGEAGETDDDLLDPELVAPDVRAPAESGPRYAKGREPGGALDGHAPRDRCIALV